MKCGLACRNKAGEGAHMFRSHGIFAAERRLFDETQCPQCLREFHTFSRMKLRLRASRACMNGLRARRMTCPLAPGAGSCHDTALARSETGTLPFQRVAGPLPAPVPLPAPPLVDWSLWAWFTEQLIDLPHLSLSDLENHLRLLPDDLVISWTLFHDTLTLFGTEFSQEDAELCERSSGDVRNLIDNLLTPHSWAWFQQPDLPPVKAHQPTLEDYQQWCKSLTGFCSPWFDHEPISRPIGRSRILLHAFSGRRRPGDVQDFIDAGMKHRDEYIVLTVSLDLVVDRVWGDISIPATRRFWISAARDGLLIGLLCGPPCNTWSIARGRNIDEAAHPTLDPGAHTSGPRIVRSADELWGFASLAIRELEAVLTGNQLLIFCLEVLLWLYCGNGFGMLEHPQEPSDPALATIWKLPIVRMLLSYPEFQRLSVMQGLYGAKSAKPTDLLLLRLPDAISTFHSWRMVANPPHGGSIGKDGEHFRTTSLKEYPPAFCGAIANTFLKAFDSTEVRPSPEMPPDFLETANKLHCTVFSSTIGQDFAR